MKSTERGTCKWIIAQATNKLLSQPNTQVIGGEFPDSLFVGIQQLVKGTPFLFIEGVCKPGVNIVELLFRKLCVLFKGEPPKWLRFFFIP